MPETLPPLETSEKQIPAYDSFDTSKQAAEWVFGTLGKKFNKDGVMLWWTSPHASLGISPEQLWESDPDAVLRYAAKFDV